MDLGLDGAVVFVGGSSAGIGLATARAFLAEGASVAITGRDAARLATAHADLSVVHGGRVIAVQADLTDPAAIGGAIDRVRDAWGHLDCVVAAVGQGAVRSGWDLERSDWEQAMQTNLLASMSLVRASLPALKGQPNASLTFITSIAGVEAIDAPLSYSAAKAALLSATKSLARLVAADGVRVNAVAPGNVLFPGGRWAQRLTADPSLAERVLRDVPLGRFGDPEEIADAVVFLASRRAAFITGACLVIDGGQTRGAAQLT